ncbi:acyltransferase family protein [Xanthomonas arboricola]|uniref:acyltransferase family protein n=1 Tax=Xanthomonas arboricola TaxID=56448 RepID=UPI00141A95BC|nr:acyltransferase family protein [Xanthomonas arboricola]NIK50506.1 peptidoglycan/LPS O-acetylase OafA/YrhL [Xanthomonas arboricola]
MTRSATGNAYFAHIDGLRALAVLSVIAYHLDASWLPGGFTGVDIFFVISGFVVSASVDRLPRIAVAAELARFYARRLRRIAPALLVCVLVTALFSTLFIPESWLSEASAKTGRMALFGLSNWVLASVGQDYFSPRAEFNPYTQTWSLGVEEQFYLLFPWMFLAWMRGGAGRAWSLGLFVLASAASLGYAWQRTQVPGHEVTSFYLTIARFWQLGAGVVLFQLMALLRRRDGQRVFAAGIGLPAPLRAVLLLLALVGIGNGLWNARPGHSPWSDGLWPVVGTLVMLALLHRHSEGWIGRVLSARPVVTIGRISYSLYLWHWPVLVLLRWTIGLDAVAAKLLALVLTVVCAAASYRWVELPWRNRRMGGWSNVRVVMAGLAALVLAFGVQSAVIKSTPYTSLSVVSRHPLDWYAYARGLRKELPDCRLIASNASVGGQPVRIFARGQCSRPAASQRQVFVIGDSHALAYNEMLRRFPLLEGGSVRMYGVAGCAVASMQPGGQGAGCDAFLRPALEDVAGRARAGDVLFLPGLRVPRLAEQDVLFDLHGNIATLQSEPAQRERDATVAATIALLAPVQARGVLLVFEAPKPVLRAPPYRCSDWFNRGNAICANGMQIGRKAMEDYRAPALDGLRRIASGLGGASIWDPLPSLCDAQVCAPTRQGRPLFFDADHLSGYGNRVLLPGFAAHLRGLPASAPVAQ